MDNAFTRLFIQAYEPGSSSIAGYLSRSPVSESPSKNLAEEYVCHLTANLLPVASLKVNMIPLKTQLFAKFIMHLGQVVGTNLIMNWKHFTNVGMNCTATTIFCVGIGNLSFLVFFGLRSWHWHIKATKVLSELTRG